MNYDACIDRLLSLPKYSDGVGFRRMAHLLADLSAGDWWRTSHHFHIVGTDGKGSTAAILSALLAPWAGGRIGRYTSPHLIDFRERIVCDGTPISPAALLSVADWVLHQVTEWQQKTGGQMAAFEAFTAMAARYFESCSTTANVWEAGIGGRLDPTRWLQGEWAALTSVGLDHTELLGPTTRHIALDKMDVLREGGTLIVGVVPDDLRPEIEAYAHLKGIQVDFVADACTVLAYELTPSGCRLQLRIEDWELPAVDFALTGAHQVSNLQVALLLLKRWLAKHHPTVCQAAFAERLPAALMAIQWPGRFQLVADAPAVYVDVGHTEQAYRQVAALIKARAAQAGKPVIGIVGLSQGKSAEGLVKAFEGCFQEWIATQAQHRGQTAKAVAMALAAQECAYEVAPDSRAALDQARRWAHKNEGIIVVVGSLFLAVEVAQLCAGKSLEALKFF